MRVYEITLTDNSTKTIVLSKSLQDVCCESNDGLTYIDYHGERLYFSIESVVEIN